MTRLTTLLCLLLTTGTPVSATGPDWIARTLAALDAHLAAHPVAEAQDAYKLLHQAVMGPGHAVGDPAAAHRWLDREIAGLQPTHHDDPLCEPIGGEPEMARIHLRSFVARGLEPDDLADAFVATADGMPPPPPGRLDLIVRAAVDHLHATGATARADALDALRIQLSGRDFPAVHHSPAFREAYAPAYRIVARGLANAAGWCDDPATTADTTPSDTGATADVDAGARGGS